MTAINVSNCSFCGKAHGEVAMMIVGPGVCICDDCVENCVAIIFDQYRKKRPLDATDAVTGEVKP